VIVGVLIVRKALSNDTEELEEENGTKGEGKPSFRLKVMGSLEQITGSITMRTVRVKKVKQDQ